MKHMKPVEIPARKEMRIEKVTCDLCGNDIKKYAFDLDEAELRMRVRAIDISIRHNVGPCFPEGASITETSADICGECFTAKLVPWLESQGVVMQVREPDY